MSAGNFRQSNPDVAPDLDAPVPLHVSSDINYLTPSGAKRLREELAHLVEFERPQLAAAAETATTKRRLEALDQRIRYLDRSLSTAQIVPPPLEDRDVVRFGATVTIEDEAGEVLTYRLVGADEAEPQEEAISWTSPIARALLNKRAGDYVRFKTPVGEREFDILHVEY